MLDLGLVLALGTVVALVLLAVLLFHRAGVSRSRMRR